MTRHLVTGGAGFLGSALVRRLLERGDEVVVLDRMSRGKVERVPEGAVPVKADIRDPDAVLVSARDVDAIWHLAYVQGTQTFYADPRTVIDVALRGILNVLAAIEDTATDLILVSSSEAYAFPAFFPTDETVPLTVPDVTNPRYSYGGGKIAAEVAAMAYAGGDGRMMIVRPHNVIGPDMGEDHVVPQLARRVQNLSEGEPLKIQGDGTATRCFCYVDDAVAGLEVLWERGEDRNVYHLGDARTEIPILHLARRIATFYGADPKIAPTELPKGSPWRRVPDTTKLEALGYRPRIGFPEALARTLDWYRE